MNPSDLSRNPRGVLQGRFDAPLELADIAWLQDLLAHVDLTPDDMTLIRHIIDGDVDIDEIPADHHLQGVVFPLTGGLGQTVDYSLSGLKERVKIMLWTRWAAEVIREGLHELDKVLPRERYYTTVLNYDTDDN